MRGSSGILWIVKGLTGGVFEKKEPPGVFHKNPKTFDEPEKPLKGKRPVLLAKSVKRNKQINK